MFSEHRKNIIHCYFSRCHIEIRNSPIITRLFTTWLCYASQGRQHLMCYLLCLLHYALEESHSLLRYWSSDLCPVTVASTWPSHAGFLCPLLPPPSPTDGAQAEPGASANVQDVFASACVFLESQSSSECSLPLFHHLENRCEKYIFVNTSHMLRKYWQIVKFIIVNPHFYKL